MSITKTEIFIASRFDEFSELRTLLSERINRFSVLPLQAVDLNDNAAGVRPPLNRCIEGVKSAEIMILLIGETYGGSPPGENLSYTHLEYRAAIDEESSTMVLPYFIGPSYKDKLKTYSSDPKLAAWQKEIMEKHTPSFYQSTEDLRELAHIIFDGAMTIIYEASSKEMKRQIDLASMSGDSDYEPESQDAGIGEESSGLSQEELERLDANQQSEEGQIFDDLVEELDDLSEIMKRPAEVAAMEQRREAFKALELGDRFVAIKSFRRALEHRPLDLQATYWLARLLSCSDKKKDCRESIRLALFACKMADHSNKPLQVSTSLIVAAKASAKLNEHENAIEYAKKAVDAAPWLGVAHIELACQYANNNDLDAAFQEAKVAFNRFPNSILNLNRDPAFLAHSREYKKFKNNLREEMLITVQNITKSFRTAVEKIVDDEDRIEHSKLLSDIYRKLPSRPLLNLLNDGKVLSRSYYTLLQKEAEEIITAWDRGSHLTSSMLSIKESTDMQSSIKLATIFLCVIIILLIIVKQVALSFILMPILFVAAFYWKKQSCNIKILKDNISNDKNVFKQRIENLCHEISEFEAVINKQQMINIGTSFRKAKHGSIVRIDTKLQADMLANCEVDDSLLPIELAEEIDAKKFVNSNRVKFYRVINSFGHSKCLSRWALYFPY